MSEGPVHCAKRCVDFINRSPSPFHAVFNAVALLKAAGFEQLSERDTWQLAPNKKYFFTRNQSTLVAFAVGGQYKAGNGLQLVAAHTDSPHPKVKPASAMESQGYQQVGVELYGGGLWHTWFDRDLSVAGRVMIKKEGGMESRLVMVDRPLMRIPTLAIHLTNAEERAAFAPNKEDQVRPVLATTLRAALEGGGAKGDGAAPPHHPALLNVLAEELKCQPSEIGDFELSVYDNHKATIGGVCNEFVFAPRLDNLASSYCAVEGLIASCGDDKPLDKEEGIRGICLYDHEECGSQSFHGAASNLLERLIIRVTGSFISGHTPSDAEERAFRNSFVLSADMAHAVHPNYAGKHEAQHRPALHKGIVIKQNANQRYATNAHTSAVLREVARRYDVPIQSFVVRNDSPCGTTVGPILAANTGVRVVDIGAAQLSMHSVREMCGADDLAHYERLFKGFFESFQDVDRAVVVAE